MPSTTECEGGGEQMANKPPPAYPEWRADAPLGSAEARRSTQKMKIIGIIVTILVLVASALLIYAILAQGPRWPHPDDWNPVLAECAHISDTAPAGLYPKEKWGPAIRSLDPRFVRFEDKRINIVLSTGGIGDPWGFLIFPDLRTNAPSGDGARFRMIEPGVYTYK